MNILNTFDRMRHILAAVLLGALLGGTLVTAAPAGAEMAATAATSWTKIWAKKLQPQADKRYYTKPAADARYLSTADAEANFIGKAEAESRYLGKSDADARFIGKTDAEAMVAAAAAAAEARANTTTDGKLGGYVTKDQAAVQYAPLQPVYRGSFMLGGTSVEAGTLSDATHISWGTAFPTAPTPHYIGVGEPVPSGCSGTPAAPNAASGHLCVFEKEVRNRGLQRICSGGAAACGMTDPWGATIYLHAQNAGTFLAIGTWATRP